MSFKTHPPTKEKLIEWAKLGGDTSRKKKQERADLYNSNPKRCKQCKEIIPYEKKELIFCNTSCAATYNNLNCSYHPNGYKSIYENVGYEKPCDFCGKILKRRNKIRLDTNVFCSGKCRGFYYIQIKVLNGEYVKGQTLRQYLIETKGWKCEDCELEERRGKPIPLDMHHIDGDISNNNIANLKLLCKNCHGITNNYGAKNKGSGCQKVYYRKYVNRRLENDIAK